MGRASETKWFRLRVAFALGVLVLLAFELSGHRSLLVTLPQALLILGIIVTSALDLRDLRRGEQQQSGRPRSDLECRAWAQTTLLIGWVARGRSGQCCTGTGIKQTPAQWLVPGSPGRGRAPGPAPRSSGARAADAARRPGSELPRCPLATLGCSRTFGLLNELLPSFAAQEGGAQTPAHRVPPPAEVVPSHVLYPVAVQGRVKS